MSKLIIISGGMGGIGRACAERLAHDGHALVLLYKNTPRDEVDTFLSSLPGPHQHRGFSCDITDRDAINAVIQTIEESSAGIDICIHAAVSPLVRRRISLIDPNDFRQQFEVTTFAALHFFQAVATHMKKRNAGSIIGLTTAALEPGSGPTTMAGYVCAKYALYGILREFSQDLAPNNIRVNAVAPDFIDTPLHRDLPEAARTMIRAQHDSHAISPAAVAETVAYLCTEKAKLINGRSFLVGDVDRAL